MTTDIEKWEKNIFLQIENEQFNSLYQKKVRREKYSFLPPAEFKIRLIDILDTINEYVSSGEFKPTETQYKIIMEISEEVYNLGDSDNDELEDLNNIINKKASIFDEKYKKNNIKFKHKSHKMKGNSNNGFYSKKKSYSVCIPIDMFYVLYFFRERS